MKVELRKYRNLTKGSKNNSANMEDGEFYVSSAIFSTPGTIVNKIAPEYIDNVLFVDFEQESPYEYQLITDISYEELLEAFNSGLCIIGRIYDGNGNLKYTTKNINIEHAKIQLG